MHAFHNAHLIRKVLPRSLTAPRLLYSDRWKKHCEQARILRKTNDQKRQAAQEKRRTKAQQANRPESSRNMAESLPNLPNMRSTHSGVVIVPGMPELEGDALSQGNAFKFASEASNATDSPSASDLGDQNEDIPEEDVGINPGDMPSHHALEDGEPRALKRRRIV